MTLAEAVVELERLGTEQNRRIYRRHGAGDSQFGVSFANLRSFAKRIKVDHDLAPRHSGRPATRMPVLSPRWSSIPRV